MRISDWSSDVCSSDLIDLCPADVRNVALVASREIDTQQTVAQHVEGRYHRVTLHPPEIALRRDHQAQLLPGYLPIEQRHRGRLSALELEVLALDRLRPAVVRLQDRRLRAQHAPPPRPLSSEERPRGNK